MRSDPCGKRRPAWSKSEVISLLDKDMSLTDQGHAAGSSESRVMSAMGLCFCCERTDLGRRTDGQTCDGNWS
jgi:hypothetical protein